MPVSLPIDEILPDIVAGLSRNPNALVVAAPGAGKSTRVPVAVAGRITGQVLLLQPRRIAARAAAARTAEEQGWKLGEEIGYQIRFENRTSMRSRIVVMTEGILARRIQRDPFLEGVGCVIIDEFHERNLHTDVAIALLREIQQEVRPDLRIIVMSATVDPAPVCEFLQTSAVHTSEGRTYPLQITHGSRVDQRRVDERMAEAIIVHSSAANTSRAPHLLAFLPGMAEIRRTIDALPPDFKSCTHILHSSVSAADQEAALRPSAKQKIILATNIAETSLTIDGVGLVIDSGLARVPVHDARVGIDRLETRRISKASATQRAGRAGRSGPGQCIRLFSAEEYSAMAEYETPEIQRLDLASLILTLKAYGVASFERFQWYDPPPRASLERAHTLLEMLECLDEQGALTAWGKALATLPLHPRLGCMLLHGVTSGYPKEAAWLCALLEGGDVNPTGSTGSHNESDVLDRLDEVLRNPKAVSWSIQNAAAQLTRLANSSDITDSESAVNVAAPGARPSRDIALRQAILRGLPDRVTLRRGKGEAYGVMVGRRGIRLAPQCRVSSAELFVAVDVRESGRTPAESTVYSASAIERHWLKELFPDFYRVEEAVRSNGKRFVGIQREVFVDLILSEKDTGRLPADFNASDALRLQLLEEHGSPLNCVLAVEGAAGWLRRYVFLRVQLGAEEFPLPDYKSALEMACEGNRRLSDFQQSALHCLQATLPPAAVRAVAELAPEHLLLPSGNRARIHYPELSPDTGLPDAEAPPTVAARVQELFGLAETPRVARGRSPLLVQLLSPAMRPVQLTRDLKSFWNTTYQEVRKELRARYPKHPWPEDPWTSPAVSVGRRRHHR